MILYKKSLTKEEQKTIYKYDEPIKTKDKISECQNCKYFSICDSKITRKNFKFVYRKAAKSCYYEFENKYSDCLIIKKRK